MIETKKEHIALKVEIEQFKEEALKMHIVQILDDSYMNTSFFDYNIDSDCSVIWYKAQARQLWDFWQASKAQAVSKIVLQNDCMIDQTWFMKGSSLSALITYAENNYKAEVVSQNSKIEFGTDDNEHWFAHDVPFFGDVQIDRIEEQGLVEWDICMNGCWQGPFNSKSECIQHLEECIREQQQELPFI